MASDLKAESERGRASKGGRGESEQGQCQQLSSQHSQLKSGAQLRNSQRADKTQQLRLGNIVRLGKGMETGHETQTLNDENRDLKS